MFGLNLFFISFDLRASLVEWAIGTEGLSLFFDLASEVAAIENRLIDIFSLSAFAYVDSE
jgi:hypothetical protein